MCCVYRMIGISSYKDWKSYIIIEAVCNLTVYITQYFDPSVYYIDRIIYIYMIIDYKKCNVKYVMFL